KAIKLASENFPSSEFYKTNEIITQMGTGEALVTVLNEKGIPTPLAVCMIQAPMSRMDVLSQNEIDQLIDKSTLVNKYNSVIDRESAYELLNKKLSYINDNTKTEKNAPSKTNTTKTKKEEESFLSKQVIKVLTSATFIRGAFGVLSKML